MKKPSFGFTLRALVAASALTSIPAAFGAVVDINDNADLPRLGLDAGFYFTTPIDASYDWGLDALLQLHTPNLPTDFDGGSLVIAPNVNQNATVTAGIVGLDSFTSYSTLAQAMGWVDLLRISTNPPDEGGTNLFYTTPAYLGFGTYNDRTTATLPIVGYTIDATDYSGAGNLRWTFADTVMVLAGENTYTGDTFVAGTMMVAAQPSLGITRVNIGQGTLFITGEVIINQSGSDLSFANAIAGTGALTFMGDTTLYDIDFGVSADQGASQTITLTYDSVNYSGAVTIESATAAGASNTVVLGDNSTVGPTANTGTLGTGSISVGRLDGDLGGGAYSLTQLDGGQPTARLRINLSGAKTIANSSIALHAMSELENTGDGDITVTGSVTSGANDSVNIINQNGDLTFTGTVTLGANGLTTITNNSSGDLTFSGAIASGGQIDIANNGDGDLFLDGNVSGLVFIDQNGAGTTRLTGTNTFTGIISVNNVDGVLEFTNSGALGSGLIKLAGGTLKLGGDTPTTISNAINVADSSGLETEADLTFTGAFTSPGAGVTLTKIGSASLILTGNNDTFAGSFVIDEGTLQAGNGGTTGTFGTNDIAVGDGATVAVNRSDLQGVTIGNDISGDGNFLQLGTGLTLLTGDNSYTGTTTISAGTLRVFQNPIETDQSTLGTFGEVINDATLDLAGAVGGGGAFYGITNIITGTGSVTHSNTGITVLLGANTYEGVTAINAGTLSIGYNGTEGTLGTGAVTIADAAGLTFYRSDTISVANDITGTGNALLTNLGFALTLTGEISGVEVNNVGGGTLTITNGGALNNLLNSDGEMSVTATSVIDVEITSGTTNTVIADITGDIEVGGGFTLTVGGGGADTTSQITGSTAVVDGTLNLATNASYNLTGLSGSGTVNQQGSGTVTLAATGAYSGDIVLSNGTVAFDAAGDLSTATVRFAGGTLEYTGVSALVLTNAIEALGGTLSFIRTNGEDIDWSGYGSITLIGGGSAVVRVVGGGTFSPLGTINNVQFITSDFDLLGADYETTDFDDSMNVTNSVGTATLTITNNTTGTASGNFTDTNPGILALVKNGVGDLTLTGTNTYSGGTTVNAGTLTAGSSTAFGTGAITLDGGALASDGDRTFSNAITLASTDATSGVAGDGDLTLTGIITGTGSLTKNGTGSLTLSGDNDYSGGTTLLAGTLIVDSDTALGAGLLTLNGGTLATSGPHTLANAVDFAGATTVDGTGILTLTGDISGSATLTVSAGTLAFGGSGDNTLAGAITGAGKIAQNGTGTLTLTNVAGIDIDMEANSGTLELNNSGSFTLTNDISGAGTVDLSGNGTTTLDTNLSLTGDLRVLAGQTLAGTGGSAGSLVNFGVVSPGNSPGILSFGGDFVNNGGTVNIEIAGNDGAGALLGHDQIQYAGQAILNGGTLNLDFGSFSPTGNHTYQFLLDTNTASGPAVAGPGFDTINILSDDPLTVLGLVTTSSTGMSYSVFDRFASIIALHDGLTEFDPALVAQVIANPVATQPLLDALVSGGAAATAALTNASPLGLGSLTALAIDESRGTVELMRTRLDAQRRAGFEKRLPLTTYANVTGSTSDASDASDTATFDRNYVGGKVGLERAGRGGFALGGNLGYDRGSAKFHDGGGKTEQDHGAASVYVSDSLGKRGFMYVGAFAGYSSYTAERNTVIGVNKGDTDGWDMGVSVILGYEAKVSDSFVITPYAGLTYAHSQVNGYDETGNVLALKVSEYSQDSLRTRLGSDFDWKADSAGAVRVGLGVAYEHEMVDSGKVDIPAAFATGSNKFVTTSTTLPNDLIGFGPHISWNFGANSVRLGYEFQYGFGDETSHRMDLTYCRRF